jgi:hypothetical protein
LKKYSWLSILAFVFIVVALVVLASKNESVRDTFMKAAWDAPAFINDARIFAENALLNIM